MTYQEREILARHKAGHTNLDISVSLGVNQAIVEAIIQERHEKELLIVCTGAVMTTLLEMGNTAPRSIIQMALKDRYTEFEDLMRFNMFCGALERLGWITVTANKLILTDDGIEQATKMEASISD